MDTPTSTLHWTPAGWQTGAPAGLPDLDEGALRIVLPGVANLHSHAFQRAMSGLTERRGPGPDSFWSWRERMYALAGRFDPDSLRAVAAQLYAEMLEAGYTAVCEFHYLHHAPDGRPYADPAAMSLALIEAARETGIQLQLLPVLYRRGGFDGRALSPRQQRFGHDVEAYLRLLDRLRAECVDGIDLGVAFHSLRAVDEADIRAVLAAVPPHWPIHIHIAEQQAEVDDCLAVHGARPVRWLLDRIGIDRRWNLVHATHLDAGEVRDIAASAATVVLCPTTEANLGDGLFPLRDFLDVGGRIGIGSDSHASVSLVEELRWLEYGQRLRAQARNVVAGSAGQSCGETLFRAVVEGGWQACPGLAGRGHLLLDAQAVELAARVPEDLLDGWLFGSSRPLLREVHCGGRRWVDGGRHLRRSAIESAYRTALRTLLQR